jgi:hypothetical protein
MTLIPADIDLLLPHLHTTHASLPHFNIFANKFLLLLIRFLRFILPLICSLFSHAPFYKCRSSIMDLQNSHSSNRFPRPILCGDIFLTEFSSAFVKHDCTIHALSAIKPKRHPIFHIRFVFLKIFLDIWDVWRGNNILITNCYTL